MCDVTTWVEARNANILPAILSRCTVRFMGARATAKRIMKRSYTFSHSQSRSAENMQMTYYLKSRCHLWINTWVVIKQNPRHPSLPGGIADFPSQPIQLKMSPSADVLANVLLLDVNVKHLGTNVHQIVNVK